MRMLKTTLCVSLVLFSWFAYSCSVELSSISHTQGQLLSDSMELRLAKNRLELDVAELQSRLDSVKAIATDAESRATAALEDASLAAADRDDMVAVFHALGELGQKLDDNKKAKLAANSRR